MREGAGSIRTEAKVWSYRWEGFTHQELYAHVKGEAKGTAMVEATISTWATFIDGVTQTRGAVERLLAEAGAEWQGGAAQSMAAGVSPLAAWADQAALAGQQSQASLQQVAEAFTHTANAMPEPPPAKPTQGLPDNFLGMIAGQTDEDAADQQGQQAHLRAIDLMNGYNTQSQVSSLSTGTFVEPKPIGVNAQVDGGMGRSGGDTIETSSSDDSSGNSSGPGSEAPGAGGPGGGSPGGGGPNGSSSPYPGSQPGGSPSPGSQSGTDAAAAQAPPAPNIPSGGGTPNVPTTSPPPTSHPFAPITGVLNEPGRGGGPGGRGGGGFGGRSGGLPGGGGAPGSGGAPAPGRGGLVSAGPLPAEGAAARGGPAAGGRGGAPGAFGPMGGAGAGQKDEDKERTSAEYLRDYNDEFWDDTPPVAPPVIGEDDD